MDGASGATSGAIGASGGRVLVAAAVALALPAVVGAVALHAAHLRAERTERAGRTLAVVARLPSSDLALSGGSRWLRSLSLEEPAAVFADAPASPDPDPAGGALGVPREAFVREATEAREAREAREDAGQAP